MLKMRIAGVLLASGGIMEAMYGPGLARASGDPSDDQIVELSIRYAESTCDAVARLPEEQGVNGAIANVMNRNALPRSDAEQVVGLSVKNSCPQYLPLVQQVVPNFQ
jgi:hypothetical protein